MDKVIKLLREQVILCSRLSELFKNLSEALKTSTSGTSVTTSVQSIELLMSNLSKNDLNIRELLKSYKISDLKTFVENNSNSIEGNVANNLLIKLGNLQKRIRHQITNVARLLINSKKFIDYNINVMTQTVASTTYGPSNANIGNLQKRRMFDANI